MFELAITISVIGLLYASLCVARLYEEWRYRRENFELWDEQEDCDDNKQG